MHVQACGIPLIPDSTVAPQPEVTFQNGKISLGHCRIFPQQQKSTAARSHVPVPAFLEPIGADFPCNPTDIDELARIDRICGNWQRRAGRPARRSALRELAENYGRAAAKMTVVRIVDCSRRRLKSRAILARLTGHPFRQLLIHQCLCPSIPDI